MRVLLVTSQLNIVPGGNRVFLERLLDIAGQHVAGLVLLRNLTRRNLAAVGGLLAVGAFHFGGALAKNLLELPLKRRERLFSGRGLPVLSFERVNDPAVASWISDNRIDLVVNTRTDQIYRRKILRAPRLGCINIHHGLLPEERGLLCDLFAMAENKPAGFTVHVMTRKVDAGPILIRRTVTPAGEKDYLAHVRRTARIEGQVVGELIETIAQHGVLPEGIPNRCDAPVIRRFDDPLGALRLFREAGIRL